MSATKTTTPKLAAKALAKPAGKKTRTAPAETPALDAVPETAVVAEPTIPTIPTAGATATTVTEATSPPPKAAKAKKTQPAKTDSPKKLSALDAAAKVLADSSEPMNTKAMIESMAAKAYWTSPGGKTPSATLYSALLREIDVKKEASRFRKVAKGLFEATGK